MGNDIRVSLVLPAYNEADYLRACLEAIARQTVKPFEVIVVDNNSTDRTAEIAQSFSFVRLIREKRQGVVYARSRGFDAARGDVIGRIDVDTLLPADWVANVQEIFTDPNVAATSGVAKYYDVALPRIFNRVELFFRRRLAKKLALTDNMYLHGANMAIRRSAWRSVRQALCYRGNMHEDFDLGIHLQEYGHKVTFDERLAAYLSARRSDVSYPHYIRYAHMSPHTYALHEIASRKHMYVAVTFSILCYVPIRILYRGYDVRTGRFSFALLFRPTEGRISPAIAED